MKRPDSSSKTAPNRTPDRSKEAAPETDADRAQAIVTSLRNSEPSSDEMYEAFWQLDSLPVNDVRKAFTSWLGPLPDIDRLDPVTRRAHGFPLPALRLRSLSVVRDADILDLGPIAEAQLRFAGTTWDGADLAPEDRLDGEIEDSLAGTIEHRVLVDVDAPEATPLFDVVLFAESSGVVFAAGTTMVIALIAYRKVETRDRRVRTAVEDALYAPAPIATPTEVLSVVEESVVEEPIRVTKAVIKEAPIKKPAIKKATIKKTAIKKTALEKTPIKKQGAKVVTKPLAKKAVAEKTSAKKSSAKKSSAKTTGAKKSASLPKKAIAKKGAAKKKATTPTIKKTTAKKSAAKKVATRKTPRSKPGRR